MIKNKLYKFISKGIIKEYLKKSDNYTEGHQFKEAIYCIDNILDLDKYNNLDLILRKESITRSYMIKKCPSNALMKFRILSFRMLQ